MVSIGMQNHRPLFQIQLLGDHAIVYKKLSTQLKDIDLDLLAFNQYIKNEKIKGVKDIILAYDTLTLIYDIIQFDANPFLVAHQILESFSKSTIYFEENEKKSILEIPVCYDLSLGIDLKDAAKIANCSIETLIQKHTKHIYNVYCLGFLPGFAYMGDVPDSIRLPRHQSPRPKVVAGSVGIAGKQTGIYPMDSPGGWQIIGRTPIKIFDPVKLSLLKVGDQVKFNSIDLEMFHQLNNQ